MKFTKPAYIVMLVGLVTLTGFQKSEDDFISLIKEQLNLYSKNHPEEKVYLQFDKPFYKPGEDIWFNVFLLDGSTHKPSSTSDVVYIELSDPKGNKVSTLSLFVKDGTARGDFSLEESVAGGIYSVTAYTRWMQNAGELSYFYKKIPVQKVITPRLLLKIDFEKEAYGPGDEVNATLTASDLKNIPLANAEVHSTIRLQGEVINTNNYTTNEQGKLTVSLKLPGDLSTTDGILHLRITAHGQEESITRSVPIVLNKITLKFYPEGGDMLSGTNCQVAFEALNEFGKGADVSGYIVDERNTVVTSFTSFHMGMGAFNFIPREGHTYKARITTPAGNDSLFSLPTATPSGYTIHLERGSASTLSGIVQASQTGEAFLVGQSHGIIYYAEKILLKKGANPVTIKSNLFPAGIAVFTLFNAEGLEEAERLVFLNQQKTLHVTINTDKKNYTPQEKVQITIRTTDDAGKPVPAKLSLSVADDQLISFADDKQDNILSWMFLSSELKGKIQEPSFYFDPTEPKASAALDYLMLVRGWRRFTWKEVFRNNTAITWLPENNSTISGFVLDPRNNNTEAEVTLLELGNRRRIAKVKSTRNGQFTFKNIDASTSILLLTRRPNQLSIPERPVFSSASLQYSNSLQIKESTVPVVIGSPTRQDVMASTPTQGSMDFSMEEDVAQLQEVVVVSYGVENKMALTGSLANISGAPIENIPAYSSTENILQGRVSGLQIQQQNANAGSSSTLTLRGINSFGNGRNEPLYVIDGIPISTNLSANYPNGSILSTENISSIHVLQSPEATALFGCMAANGVILINTRSFIPSGSFSRKMRKEKYASLLVAPRLFSVTREFYTDTSKKQKSDERKNFQTTVYWNPTIVTDEKGEAQISFNNSDATSAFRITAEGITANGLIGRKEEIYSASLPFTLDAKMPGFLGFDDTLRLPVMVKNTLPTPLDAELMAELPTGLKALSATNISVHVEPERTKTYWITLVTDHTIGTFPVTIWLRGKKYSDKISQSISVHPIGFPMKLSFSDKNIENNLRFKINDIETGTLRGELTAYTDIVSDLFAGAEGILQQPHGCFEQVSSSTFPNILALQFMKESGQLQPHVEALALQYIKSGYKQLTAYEINDGGFEWFGHPPAHEALTAYGLLEFLEMKKVFNDVDDAMLSRTRDWLLSRRKGDGTFLQNHGKYGFSSASAEVNNAYMVYALAEAGVTALEKEYSKSLDEAWASKDMYRMALMANAAHRLQKENDYTQLIAYFLQQIKDDRGFNNLKCDHSITRSYDNSLLIETVSWWCIAMLQSRDKDLATINQCIQFIRSKRSFGMFGSTQGTTVALQALTRYAALINSNREKGEIAVAVNSTVTDKFSYTKETHDKIVLDKFSQQLHNGTNVVQIKFNNTGEALPYSLNIRWNTKAPASDSACRVQIDTRLTQSAIKMSETVRFTATVRNLKNEGIPMTVALIGIPGGLSLQPWQLKEMQEKGVFDFYEILDDRLAIYYRELEPNAIRVLHFDLKAEVSGNYTSRASCAYLYYTDEYKHWVKGSTVSIQ
ncbi:MAG TPA: MG2 domain-containing protein [Ohtaekwangia sp.]|uniref:MG2 domain-containing protein n=1 Tax=Ohtaekwangia sp. TaxID=2066019 RepID=UPI002F93EBD3